MPWMCGGGESLNDRQLEKISFIHVESIIMYYYVTESTIHQYVNIHIAKPTIYSKSCFLYNIKGQEVIREKDQNRITRKLHYPVIQSAHESHRSIVARKYKIRTKV